MIVSKGKQVEENKGTKSRKRRRKKVESRGEENRNTKLIVSKGVESKEMEEDTGTKSRRRRTRRRTETPD